MSQKTIFFLVRHGEAEHNVRHIIASDVEGSVTGNIHLTERGRAQIEARGEELKSEHIDIIFHSPLLRTRETAEILARATGAPMREDARLHETTFGSWEGRSSALFFQTHSSPFSRMETGADGVEGFRSTRDRAVLFLGEALREFAGKTIVVVSHGDTLEMLYGILTNETLDESLGSQRKSFATGEMVRVEYVQS